MIISKFQQLFENSYILGGSPCSGKSTIARRLAAQFGFQYYQVDYRRDHMKRIQPDKHPMMHKISMLSWNEIWSRPVTVQVQEEFLYYQERFEMILDDLQAYEADRLVILEGAAFLPKLIHKYQANPKTTLFMIPTREFQRQHYRQRTWIKAILKECDDPERAFDNWMERDHLFGQAILRQANAYQYRTLLVDGSQSSDEVYEWIKEFFQLNDLH